jgi:hypothetical protein
MSGYKRKTEDEFEIQSYTPQGGWEMATTETNRPAARDQLKCYRENEPHLQHRIIKKRVPLGGRS